MNYEINDIYRDEKYNYYICKKNGLFHTHDFYNTHLLDIPKHVKPSKKEDLGNLLYVNNLENLKEITELEYKALYCKKNKVVTFTTIKRSKKLTCLTPKENLSIYDKKFNSFTNSLLKDIIEFQTIIKYHFFWKKNDDYSKINDREIKFIVYFLKELNNYIILKDLINIAYFQAEDFNKIEKTISKKEITMKSPEFVFNEIQKYSEIS